MKRININRTVMICVAGMLLALTACKKDFDKINSSPNTPLTVPNSTLLTGAEKGLMDYTWDRWWNGTTGMLLAQYYAENQYTDESQYQFRNTTIKDYWGLFYAGGVPDQFSQSTVTFPLGGLKELQTIIEKCQTDTITNKTSGNLKNQIAVALLLQAWTFQNMTDVWGDIPFSEALKDTRNTQPKYDKQSDIYPGLLVLVDSALKIMDVNQFDLQGDMIYGGDMSKWAKFANSLKIRIAMRMSSKRPDLAGPAVAAAAAGAFTSNADNALFPYTTGSPNYNPLYYDRAITGRKDFCSSNTIIDVMNSLSDPRLIAYFDTIKNGTFVGRPYGQSSSHAGALPISHVSQPSGSRDINNGVANGSGTLSATAPGIFLDYAQIEFFLAEAVELGYISGSAEDHYKAGINASFIYWTGSPAPSSYISQPGVDYTALKASGLSYQRVIARQKWLALYMQGIQGWIECRRLDYSILHMPVDGVLAGSGVPYRMTYPYSEPTLNPNGWAQANADQGPDQLSTKVWWNK